LSITFSKAIFLGNGLVAIVAGLFANFLADNMGFGPVAPFDAAACFLAIGMAIILSSWGENYGDSSDSKDLMTQFKVAAKAIASGSFNLPSIESGLINLVNLILTMEGTLMKFQMKRLHCLELYSHCLRVQCILLFSCGLLL